MFYESRPGTYLTDLVMEINKIFTEMFSVTYKYIYLVCFLVLQLEDKLNKILEFWILRWSITPSILK